MKRSVLLLVLIVALLPSAAACASSSSSGRRSQDQAPADYRAVPDRELFSAVAALPDVTSQNLSWKSDIASGDNYRGKVLLRRGLSQEEVTHVFDQVVTVLRHGRWGASYDAVQVFSGNVGISSVSLELGLSQSYRQRYGPQTGENGWPPPFVPN